MGICLPCTLISVLAGVGVVQAFQEPEQVQIDVSSPSVTSQGQGFVIEIAVENLADELQTLDSIDIYTDYLQGITIQTSEPSFVDSSDSPDFASYFFFMDIPPGDSINVQFHAVGVRAGEFSGSLDVCINTGVACSTFNIVTSISR